MAAPDTDLLCRICSTPAKIHQVAERDGVIHHKFSTDGVLTPSKVDQSSGPAPSKPTILRTPADPVLRFLLIQHGVITAEELTEAEKTLAATGMLVVDS